MDGVGSVIPPRPMRARVGLSACLTGAKVRYDGRDKQDALPHALLDALFDYVPLCPEVAIGLGVPRPPIQLVGDGLRARGVQDAALDPTDALRRYGAEVAADVLQGVCGYIFMRGSPSCGVVQVPVHDGQGGVARDGRGVFAAAVMQHLPWLPVAENDAFEQVDAREHFLTRVFALAHWRAMVSEGLSAAALIGFHSRYKFLVMAYSNAAYRSAGQLLANLRGDVATISEVYIQLLLTTFARPVTRRGHANALQHLTGFVKDRVDNAERLRLAEAIDAYRLGDAPLMEPRTLLLELLRRAPDDYALAQVYLEPFPRLLA